MVETLPEFNFFFNQNWFLTPVLKYLNFDTVSEYPFAIDHFCGLVVSVPGYRSRGPGSNPGATRFSEK
jgi:hypothetical protein